MVGDDICCHAAWKTNLFSSAEADEHSDLSSPYIHMIGGGAAADHVLAMQHRTPNQITPGSNSEPALHRTPPGGLPETACLLIVRSEGNKIATRPRGGSKPVSAVPREDLICRGSGS